MVCPTLISVSLTPGPYCFWASAGCADQNAIAAPNSASFLTDIGFLHGFLLWRKCERAASYWQAGRGQRGAKRRRAAPRSIRARLFPGLVRLVVNRLARS